MFELEVGSSSTWREFFFISFPFRGGTANDVEFWLKNLGVVITFTEWKQGHDVVPSYELDLVWLHISGIPHAWRNYLSFWALGTVVGSTQQVGMHTLRKKRSGSCVQVGVHNKEKFPYTTDLVFERFGYDITFS